MNTNMTGIRWFRKILCILVLWAKVALALEGLTITLLRRMGEVWSIEGQVVSPESSLDTGTDIDFIQLTFCPTSTEVKGRR